MSKVAIVYWSGTGNTAKMAEAIRDGVQAAGGKASLFQAGDFTTEHLSEFTSLAFGCPSMGNEELEDREFAPMWNRIAPSLSGKKVALFGSYGWGDGEWMRLWQTESEEKGIRLVEEGLIIHEEPDADAQSACQALGQKLV